MNNDIIKIGIPSKGRLRSGVLNIFNKNKLKILSERGERDLFGFIKEYKSIKITYLHAREIIEKHFSLELMVVLQEKILVGDVMRHMVTLRVELADK